MEPLIALIVVTLAFLLTGAAGVRRMRTWPVALRAGVFAMFVLTGTVHFVWMREEIIGMVPSGMPNPGLIVSITGVLELLGAVGMLWRRTAPWAAGGLSLLLIAMFPANVHYALSGLATAPEDALVPRTLMQIAFLSATLAIAIFYLRERREPVQRR